MKLTSLHDVSVERVSYNNAIQKRVVVRNGTIPHLTNFSVATFTTGQVAYKHSHTDMVEVFFVLEGTDEIEIDGKVYRLEKGSHVVVEPNEEHEVRNPNEKNVVIQCIGIQL